MSISAITQRVPLPSEDRLKQKVLGKDEVFYGGQLFTGKVIAPPASKVCSYTSYTGIIFINCFYILIKAKDTKTLNALSMSEHAQRIKEEEELAKKNVKVEFTERLKNPTAGARNLLRCMEAGKSTSSPVASPAASNMKSITAKDLLDQHKKQLQSMKNAQLEKSQSVTPPVLGRGLLSNDREIDLSDEVCLFIPN